MPAVVRTVKGRPARRSPTKQAQERPTARARKTPTAPQRTRERSSLGPGAVATFDSIFEINPIVDNHMLTAVDEQGRSAAAPSPSPDRPGLRLRAGQPSSDRAGAGPTARRRAPDHALPARPGAVPGRRARHRRQPPGTGNGG